MVFIDTEVNPKTRQIQDIGCIKSNRDEFHSNDLGQLIKFIKREDYFVGHNIIKHDLVYLHKTKVKKYIDEHKCIDTLFLSTLLYPEKPYHSLVKDDKLYTDSVNNPLNDSKTTQKLFADIVDAFNKLDGAMKDIFFTLLSEIPGFEAFFNYMKYKPNNKKIQDLIKKKFKDKYCENAELGSFINKNQVELAYSLALINTNEVESLLPGWVLKSYPEVENVLWKLRNTPCHENCHYCDNHLSPLKALNQYFSYPSFRDFDGVPLQEQAVKAAIENRSIITVFPTGGGKSLAFQLPALMAAESVRGLTVVISPLQSLMKDQVDNLETKNITKAVFINGLLDPIQRKEAIDRVKDGSAAILYIAPESLRSKTIERLLLSRLIVRFVIDEAHCFSTWGQDFRPDYQYIGVFIKELQEKKGLNTSIPISCFTATAKKQVIIDIENYFKKTLDIEMDIFKTTSQRKNLIYKVIQVNGEEEKYKEVRNLIEQEKTSTIIYSSRRKTVENLYTRLKQDNFEVSYFHGGLEKDRKTEQQDNFMKGVTEVMVATNAFGMGVDKSDIGCVIHYDISDSLENYVQESGRAGRDQNMTANCYVLYDENDLNKHFELLNNSKLNKVEIEQIWTALKNMTKLRDSVSKSTLEIAREAGWDEEIYDIDTRVKTAIASLEEVGYIKRGQNSPRVFATSIRAKNVEQANAVIDQSKLFNEKEKEISKRIMKSLISNKYRLKPNDEIPEMRVDYIADNLGLDKEIVIRSINLLREAKLLEDDNDVFAQIKKGTKSTVANKQVTLYAKIITYLLNALTTDSKIYNTKVINEELINENISSKMADLTRTFNYLSISHFIETKKINRDNLKIKLLNEQKELLAFFNKRLALAYEIIDYLFKKSEEKRENEYIVNFSLVELKKQVNQSKTLFDIKYDLDDIEAALLFLSKIKALQIEGGFLVLYSPMYLTRIEKNSLKQFTNQDYANLYNHYENKKQQIHIVGEYAKKMVENYQSALKFVNDYFVMDYKKFLDAYFPGNRKEELERNMSPKRFFELFGNLSTEQLTIIKDKEHSRIAVAAGPGSGKTRVLVHKLASIISTEDIRSEQLLMLTFSRAAVTEFKERLFNLIGSPAYSITITTFHSYAFDVVGRLGSIDTTDDIIKEATELIKNREVNPVKATKMVLVIDEAQDMNLDEYNLVEALMEYNESLRVIAVGDDDQNIFEWRGSSSDYFRSIVEEEEAFYELPVNFRSKSNLVDFSNQFVHTISKRLKKQTISSYTKELGTIKITKYNTTDLIVPVVNDVINANLKGSTCIITRTNEQAIHIAGLLNLNGKKAQLIQTNDEFRLFNVFEIRQFIELLEKYDNPLITEGMWTEATEKLKTRFSNSKNFEMIDLILNKFKTTAGNNPYLSDLIEFVYESNFSDFYIETPYTVSTFHKAKGKEFDNVFILYDNVNKSYTMKDEEKRKLYVGLTRAKTNISIHTSSPVFDKIKTNNQQNVVNDDLFEKPQQFIFHLTHRDIYLNYSKYVQNNIKDATSGDELTIEDDILKYKNRKAVQFSNAAKKTIENTIESGYVLKKARINHMVYWYDKEKEEEALILLPELMFELISEP